ncbi:MAG: 30S ribosomal protein S24e [Candidatus Thermoplasmatota archaeon]|nr:30S ribosomal protein S24e [Candidatus Thermoplasmatota archaeon]
MDIEVVEKHDNILLERTEVRLLVKHSKERTPSRKELAEALKDVLGMKKETLIIDTVDSEFGKNTSKVYVKLYKDLQRAKDTEDDHILIRNGLMEKKTKKKAGAAQQAAPAK